VLLLDEPFRGLDAPLRDTILADLAALVAERSIAVLAASHDPLEPLALHARVFRMDGGKVAQAGPAAQVLAPEVAAMLQKLRSIS
jgi:ABC-type sulfate/molybdate transport systems ATPase subunit